MFRHYIALILTFFIFINTSFAGFPPTTSKVSGDSSNVVTFNYQFPNFTGTHTGTTVSLGVNGIAGGGTNNGSLAVTAGGVLYTDGSKIVNVGAGTSGQVVTSNGSSAPGWTTIGIPPSTGSNFSFTTLSNPTTNVQTNFSNGSQTVTLSGSGTFKWRIILNGMSAHSNVYTFCRMTFALGGTATRQDTFGAAPLNEGITAQSNNQYFSLVIYGTATNGQTVTIYPNAQVAYTVGNHNFDASYILEYLP